MSFSYNVAKRELSENCNHFFLYSLAVLRHDENLAYKAVRFYLLQSVSKLRVNRVAKAKLSRAFSSDCFETAVLLL